MFLESSLEPCHSAPGGKPGGSGIASPARTELARLAVAMPAVACGAVSLVVRSGSEALGVNTGDASDGVCIACSRASTAACMAARESGLGRVAERDVELIDRDVEVIGLDDGEAIALAAEEDLRSDGEGVN